MKILLIIQGAIALFAFLPANTKAMTLVKSRGKSPIVQPELKMLYRSGTINPMFNDRIIENMPLNENPDSSPFILPTAEAAAPLSQESHRVAIPVRIYREETIKGRRFWNKDITRRIPLRRHIPASIKKDLIGLPNPSRRFEMYTGIQSHYQIEVVHLDEVQPALKELNNIYSSNGAAIPDIVRNICDYIANLDSESMIDLLDFSGYMHYIAKMIQFWRPLDTLMQEDILHHALLCNIAFHMGLLSLKQKFAQNLDWINLINFLLDTLNTKLQPIMKKEKTMDNFFEKHGKGLPWVQEYFFPNRRLNIDSDNDLRIKIKFDSKLEHHLIGIDFGRIHPQNRNKDFEDHTKAIAEIAKASSPASVQSKIAAMVSLYAASIDHAIPLLDEISKSEYSDPQIKELANYILNM